MILLRPTICLFHKGSSKKMDYLLNNNCILKNYRLIEISIVETTFKSFAECWIRVN